MASYLQLYIFHSFLVDNHHQVIEMEPSGSRNLAILLGFLLFMTGIVEQSRGSGCTNTFFSTVAQLMPCRPAVAPFSSVPPTEACCNAIITLGQPCLCFLVNGPPISSVDRDMALQLPDKCTANFEPCQIMRK